MTNPNLRRTSVAVNVGTRTVLHRASVELASQAKLIKPLNIRTTIELLALYAEANPAAIAEWVLAQDGTNLSEEFRSRMHSDSGEAQ